MYPQMNSPTILSPVNSPRYIYQSGNSNQLNWAFSRKKNKTLPWIDSDPRKNTGYKRTACKSIRD